MTGIPHVIFAGTEVERSALLEALSHNCTCVQDGQGTFKSVCPGHAALASDQRFVNGMVFARRLAPLLWKQEQST